MVNDPSVFMLLGFNCITILAQQPKLDSYTNWVDTDKTVRNSNN